MRALTVLLLVLAAMPVYAQDSVYVGLGLGSFDYREKGLDPDLGRVGETVSNTRLFGGFEFNEHFAIEVSYGQTGAVHAQGSGFDPQVGDYTAVLKTDVTMSVLSAVGQLPRDWGVLLGGLGYFSSSSDFTEDFSAFCCSFRNEGTINDNGLAAKLGIEWRFGRFGTRFGVRLEYDWFDISNVNASALGLALSYGF
jgi:Outer membrane protein beta-barrel domain